MQQFTHAGLMEQFAQRLTESEQKLSLLKQQYHLTEPEKEAASIRVACSENIPPSLKRLIIYLLDNPGARSDAISRDCAIGNVSDCWTTPSRQLALKRLGLSIRCEVLPSCNRFGAPTKIGHLFLVVDAD